MRKLKIALLSATMLVSVNDIAYSMEEDHFRNLPRVLRCSAIKATKSALYKDSLRPSDVGNTFRRVLANGGKGSDFARALQEAKQRADAEAKREAEAAAGNPVYAAIGGEDPALFARNMGATLLQRDGLFQRVVGLFPGDANGRIQRAIGYLLSLDPRDINDAVLGMAVNNAQAAGFTPAGIQAVIEGGREANPPVRPRDAVQGIVNFRRAIFNGAGAPDADAFGDLTNPAIDAEFSRLLWDAAAAHIDENEIRQIGNHHGHGIDAAARLNMLRGRVHRGRIVAEVEGFDAADFGGAVHHQNLEAFFGDENERNDRLDQILALGNNITNENFARLVNAIGDVLGDDPADAGDRNNRTRLILDHWADLQGAQVPVARMAELVNQDEVNHEVYIGRAAHQGGRDRDFDAIFGAAAWGNLVNDARNAGVGGAIINHDRFAELADALNGVGGIDAAERTARMQRIINNYQDLVDDNVSVARMVQMENDAQVNPVRYIGQVEHQYQAAHPGAPALNLDTIFGNDLFDVAGDANGVVPEDRFAQLAAALNGVAGIDADGRVDRMQTIIGHFADYDAAGNDARIVWLAGVADGNEIAAFIRQAIDDGLNGDALDGLWTIVDNANHLDTLNAARNVGVTGAELNWAFTQEQAIYNPPNYEDAIENARLYHEINLDLGDMNAALYELLKRARAAGLTAQNVIAAAQGGDAAARRQAITAAVEFAEYGNAVFDVDNGGLAADALGDDDQDLRDLLDRARAAGLAAQDVIVAAQGADDNAEARLQAVSRLVFRTNVFGNGGLADDALGDDAAVVSDLLNRAYDAGLDAQDVIVAANGAAGDADAKRQAIVGRINDLQNGVADVGALFGNIDDDDGWQPAQAAAPDAAEVYRNAVFAQAGDLGADDQALRDLLDRARAAGLTAQNVIDAANGAGTPDDRRAAITAAVDLAEYRVQVGNVDLIQLFGTEEAANNRLQEARAANITPENFRHLVSLVQNMAGDANAKSTRMANMIEIIQSRPAANNVFGADPLTNERVRGLVNIAAENEIQPGSFWGLATVAQTQMGEGDANLSNRIKFAELAILTKNARGAAGFPDAFKLRIDGYAQNTQQGKRVIKKAALAGLTAQDLIDQVYDRRGINAQGAQMPQPTEATMAANMIFHVGELYPAKVNDQIRELVNNIPGNNDQLSTYLGAYEVPGANGGLAGNVIAKAAIDANRSFTWLAQAFRAAIYQGHQGADVPEPQAADDDLHQQRYEFISQYIGNNDVVGFGAPDDADQAKRHQPLDAAGNVVQVAPAGGGGVQ